MQQLDVSSVASFLVLGGGGARPPNVPTEEKKSTCNLYARASKASELLRNTYIFRSQNTSVYIIQSMQFPFITCGYGDINNSIPTKHLH